MTTLSPTADPSTSRNRPRAGAPDRLGVTFPRVVASEWIKFRTVRAAAWTLPITALLMVGLAFLSAWGTSQLPADGDFMTPSAATLVTNGWLLAQLAVAVLAVLTITGEYGTGMVRSTFAANPKRLASLGAKALVLAVTVAATSAIALALAWLAVQPFASDLDLALDLADGETVRILLGTVLYLATIAVFAFAIGALLRHSAGAIAVVVGLLLVVDQVLPNLPLRFFEVTSPFLPSVAGTRLLYDADTLALIDAGRDTVNLTPWEGYGVLALWTVLLLVAAAVLVRRRDA
ncbi:ABC transporter permease [Actinotalea sp. BY-33]|uniref:ABC transporter permease n=1 Tax=Actinotalea soli TaxID=2819234 RepID=A0A939LSL8_9CELL|nr:ABC transporter permease [Actinotalea soli]MBO1751950.1 ABC transporter permease [Actinotalea soli]